MDNLPVLKIPHVLAQATIRHCEDREAQFAYYQNMRVGLATFDVLYIESPMTTRVRGKLMVKSKSSTPQARTALFPESRTTVNTERKTALTIPAIMAVIDESS